MTKEGGQIEHVSDPWMKGGGPAFPQETIDKYYKGMSLRDYFAAKAMQEWLAHFMSDEDNHEGMDAPEIASRCARYAYICANHMLSEREK